MLSSLLRCIPRLPSGRLTLPAVVLLCGLGIIAAPSAFAQPPAPTVTIRAGEEESPTVIEVDFDDLPLQISLDADVDNEPVSNAECTITGPKYQWSGTGIDPEEASGSGATLVFDAEAVGQYTASASVSVTYKSECQDGSSSDIPLGDDASFTIKVVDVKKWSPKNGAGNEGLSGGESVTASYGAVSVTGQGPIYVPLGTVVNLHAADAQDEDTYTLAGQTTPDADNVKYEWSASDGEYLGTFGGTIGQNVTWTAPATLPAGIGSVTLTITCDINDDPKAIGEDEDGSRDDDDGPSPSITVMIVRKVWDVGLPIGKARNPDGSVYDTGRMVHPIDTRVPNAPTKLQILPGQTLNCEVEVATDLDHWTRGLEQGEAPDGMIYLWNAVPVVTADRDDPALRGTFIGSTSGRTVQWTAPANLTRALRVNLKCTLKDSPSTINRPQEDGVRADGDVLRQIEVVVFPNPQADLDIGSIADADEETVGAVVGLNNLVPLALGLSPAMTEGTLKLEATAGSGKIKVWKDAAKTQQQTLPVTWTLDDNPNTTDWPAALYVEGIDASTSMRDVSLRLTYNHASNPSYSHNDVVKATVPKASILVKRHNTGDSAYTLEARVAVGPYDTPEHLVDVQIKHILPDNTVASGITIFRPSMLDWQGQPTGTGDATLSPATVTSNAQGLGQFTFRASNQQNQVKLQVNSGPSIPVSTATLDQAWDELGLVQHNHYFMYDVPEPVTFTPKFVDEETVVPITGHTMKFVVTEVDAWVWDDENGEYVPESYSDPTGDDLVDFATFQPALVPDNVANAEDGVYSSSLLVPLDYFYLVDSLVFRVQDSATFGVAVSAE